MFLTTFLLINNCFLVDFNETYFRFSHEQSFFCQCQISMNDMLNKCHIATSCCGFGLSESISSSTHGSFSTTCTLYFECTSDLSYKCSPNIPFNQWIYLSFSIKYCARAWENFFHACWSNTTSFMRMFLKDHCSLEMH